MSYQLHIELKLLIVFLPGKINFRVLTVISITWQTTVTRLVSISIILPYKFSHLKILQKWLRYISNIPFSLSLFKSLISHSQSPEIASYTSNLYSCLLFQAQLLVLKRYVFFKHGTLWIRSLL